MNIELSKLVKNDLGTFAIAKVYFMYDTTEITGTEITIPEEHLQIDFGYTRKNGDLKILHFNVHDASDKFYDNFNHSALERFKRGVVALCETAGAAKLYV